MVLFYLSRSPLTKNISCALTDLELYLYAHRGRQRPRHRLRQHPRPHAQVVKAVHPRARQHLPDPPDPRSETPFSRDHGTMTAPRGHKEGTKRARSGHKWVSCLFGKLSGADALQHESRVQLHRPEVRPEHVEPLPADRAESGRSEQIRIASGASPKQRRGQPKPKPWANQDQICVPPRGSWALGG